MQKFHSLALCAVLAVGAAVGACGAAKGSSSAESADSSMPLQAADIPAFSGDSAYAYVKAQVDMGPRVPNSEAHARARKFYADKLKACGAEIVSQPMELDAFDGTRLHAENIMAGFNPGAADRLLLLAHFDCRPWADEDPDPTKRSQPVDGANDGASGVGVLLELARQFAAHPLPEGKGVDILLVDAEDWGQDDNDASWALGAQYFADNLPQDYSPRGAIVLDMVGSPDATFYVEYFSQQAAPDLVAGVWRAAAAAGFGRYFPNELGSAVTDDHRPLIEAGIPAIDIIDYRKGVGFDPVWHTSADGMQNISASTLQAVGQTLLTFIYGD